MDTVGPAQTLIWPDSRVYLSTKSSAAKARLVSDIETLIVYSGIPQTQGLPSRSWGFNSQLVLLHRKICVSLPQLHHLSGSVLVLTPPLRVCRPQASDPCPGE